MDRNALRWMLKCSDANKWLVSWKLSLMKFDCKVPYCPEIVLQVPLATSRLIHPSDTLVCRPFDDEIPSVECSFSASEQLLKEKRVLSISCSGNSFKNLDVLSFFHITNHSPYSDNMDNDFAENKSIIQTDEPQALGDLVFSLSTMELLEVQQFNHFCPLILATQIIDHSSGFIHKKDGLFSHRHLSMPRLHQTGTPHSLRGKL